MLTSFSWGKPKKVRGGEWYPETIIHPLQVGCGSDVNKVAVESLPRRLELELGVPSEFSGGGIQRWGEPAAPAPATGGEYPESTPFYLFHPPPLD